VLIGHMFTIAKDSCNYQSSPEHRKPGTNLFIALIVQFSTFDAKVAHTDLGFYSRVIPGYMTVIAATKRIKHNAGLFKAHPPFPILSFT
jgi:hypothetical protein